MNKVKKYIKNIIITIIILAISIIPAYKLFSSILNWHIKQPEVIQGGIEILFFIIITFIACFFDKTKNRISLIVLFLLYLSTNGVVIPAVTVYLYLEILSFIGFVFNRKVLKRDSNCINTNFILGIITWGFFAIVLSLFGLGTFNVLRILTIVLLLLAIFFNKKDTYNLLISRFLNYIKTIEKNKLGILLLIILVYVIGCSFAKSNTSLDYDSMWYGLRPEFVLMGEKSFFEYLGFSSFVFYYPKLFEFIALPISNLGDYSFIFCFNILIFALSAHLIYNFFEFSKIEKEYEKILLTLAISCTPAIVGIATTAKPDILGYYLVLNAIYFYLKHLKTKDINYLIYSLISLVLCTGTKQTYLIWGGVVGLIEIIYIIISLIKKNIKITKNLIINNWLILFLTTIFILGIHYRTYHLTGYPLYPVGLSLFNSLGFSVRHNLKSSSIGLSNSFILKNLYERIYQFLFDPTKLSHVIMLWTSNIILISFIVWLFNKKDKDNIIRKVSFKLILSLFLICSIYFIATMVNPDGNYFILPFTFISLYFIISIKKINKYVYLLIPITLVNLLLILTVNSSWSYGTHLITYNVLENNFESYDRNKTIIVSEGLEEIDSYITNNLYGEKVISSIYEMKNIVVLKCKIELANDIDAYFSSGYALTDKENFKNYLMETNTSAILLHKKDNSIFSKVVSEYLEEYGYIHKIESENFILYDI